jgi:hypothetical protein
MTRIITDESRVISICKAEGGSILRCPLLEPSVVLVDYDNGRLVYVLAPTLAPLYDAMHAAPPPVYLDHLAPLAGAHLARVWLTTEWTQVADGAVPRGTLMVEVAAEPGSDAGTLIASGRVKGMSIEWAASDVGLPRDGDGAVELRGLAALEVSLTSEIGANRRRAEIVQKQHEQASRDANLLRCTHGRLAAHCAACIAPSA